ncbi:transposase domain-containing protein [Streptomyces anulatus]
MTAAEVATCATCRGFLAQGGRVPSELVDAVLEGNGTAERRKRVLPPRAGAHFVPALGLSPHLGRPAAAVSAR